MLNRIINFSLDHRLLVILLGLALAGTGLWAAQELSIDAFPDVTNVQVQVNTVAPSLGPVEIEQQITFPIELAISGLPGLEQVRSISKFGLSQVTVVFKDGTDIYFARQLILERLQSVELPDWAERPKMGPVATGLGEIYHYLVTSERRDLTELRTLHDWVVKPILRRVPGVAEVNSWGGFERQLHAVVDPVKLAKHQLTLREVIEAIQANNLNVGGGYLTQAGESPLVLGNGRVSTREEIGDIVVASKDGVPVRVRDVAEVVEGHEIRRAAVTADGLGESVLGLGFLLMGENSRVVTRRLKEEMQKVSAALPEDTKVRVVYDRAALVDKVIDTVKKNLFEGALLVMAVLFLFLGNVRAAALVALAIPLSMLFAFNLMLRAGVAGTLMSLGAIDFGLIVDSSVIMVENSMRHLVESKGGRPLLDVVRTASIEVRKPTMFGELIIMIVYVPILTLEGIEGKLFRPMAWTVIFALAGSLILSLTLVPALASLLLPKRIAQAEPRIVRWAKAGYAPVLRWALANRGVVLAGVLIVLAGTVSVALRLGAEFVPKLDEGSIVINTVRLAGVSLDETVRYSQKVERILRTEFPDEIERIWTRTGTPEVATDPMGIEVSDIFITLKPRERWKRAQTKEDLIRQVDAVMKPLPGMRYSFTQPIEMRVNEMVAGIRTDVGVGVFGDDFEVLKAKADEVANVLRSIPGNSDVSPEQVTGQPVLQVALRQQDLQRFGISARSVLEFVECIGGKRVGEIREGQRRFPLAVRLPQAFQTDAEAVKTLLVTAPTGERIPLEKLAEVRLLTGPLVVNRAWGQRRILVQCNVRGRDVGGFVAEADEKIKTLVKLPPGYRVEFGGQFEHLIRASRKLTIVVPIALGLIFALLYISYGSIRDALLIFTGIPLAAVGGVVALKLRGMPFTVSAGVGFVALSGVAVLNGLVLVSFIRKLMADGRSLEQAVEESCLTRLRPVLMTAWVASLGFVPMALATGMGAEVQRPLATVVIGGVIGSTLLTLVVLPVLYRWFEPRPFQTDGGAEASGSV